MSDEAPHNGQHGLPLVKSASASLKIFPHTLHLYRLMQITSYIDLYRGPNSRIMMAFADINNPAAKP
jgi:hypothetical protein